MVLTILAVIGCIALLCIGGLLVDLTEGSKFNHESKSETEFVQRMDHQRIEAILITWDENEIPAIRKLQSNVNTITKYVRSELKLKRLQLYFIRPQKTIWQFGENLTAFWHDGRMIPYPKTKHKNKDLAIIKYCTIGFVDQDEYYHHILLDQRFNIYPQKCDEFLDRYILVVFVTKDMGPGMKMALKWYEDRTKNKLPNNSLFMPFVMDYSRSTIKGDKRVKDIAHALAKSLSKVLHFKTMRNG